VCNDSKRGSSFPHRVFLPSVPHSDGPSYTARLARPIATPLCRSKTEFLKGGELGSVGCCSDPVTRSGYANGCRSVVVHISCNCGDCMGDWETRHSGMVGAWFLRSPINICLMRLRLEFSADRMTDRDDIITPCRPPRVFLPGDAEKNASVIPSRYRWKQNGRYIVCKVYFFAAKVVSLRVLFCPFSLLRYRIKRNFWSKIVFELAWIIIRRWCYTIGGITVSTPIPRVTNPRKLLHANVYKFQDGLKK